MATFRKRGEAWQAQVRKSGFPSLTKTFPTKAAAARWALEQERAVELEGVPIFSQDHKKAVLEELLRRYQTEIASKKRGAKQEFYLIRALQRSALGSLTLPKLTSSAIASHRDRRLRCLQARSDESSPCYDTALKLRAVNGASRSAETLSPGFKCQAPHRRGSADYQLAKWNVC